MSLNSMRVVFNSLLGKAIMTIGTILILVTAYTGIGAILQNRGSGPAPGPQTNPATQVVVSVDGVPITRGQFDQQYDQMKQQGGMGSGGVMLAGFMRANVLQHMIQSAEAVKVAEEAGITASSSDINKARDAELGPLRTQLGLSPTASVDDINQSLEQHGAMPVDQIYPTEQLREQVLLQKYQAYLQAMSVPTDAAVTQYYRQVHTRHILISNKTRPDAQAQALAQTIIKKLNSGANFAALAKEYSDDTGTKNKGGDDGWISEATPYDPQFLKAALALNPGQITPQPVLSTQFGYFIIQALAVRENMPKDYAKNKTKYQSVVAQSLQTQAEAAGMAKVTSSPNIVIKDPLLKADYAMFQQPNAMSDPAVLADLKQALTTADYTTKGEIYAQMAEIYQQKNDLKDEIDALNSALGATEDSQLRMMLGDAYRKQGQVKQALAQYQDASAAAYDQKYVHTQLETDYTQMGQTKLAASEALWIKQFDSRQNQASATPAVGSPPASAAPPGSASVFPLTAKGK